jgi:hypothetical protein
LASFVAVFSLLSAAPSLEFIMKNILDEILSKKDRKEFKEFVTFVANQPTSICLRNGIIQLFRQYCDQYNKSQSFRRNSSLFNF